jgi:hypothetical protein
LAETGIVAGDEYGHDRGVECIRAWIMKMNSREISSRYCTDYALLMRRAADVWQRSEGVHLTSKDIESRGSIVTEMRETQEQP